MVYKERVSSATLCFCSHSYSYAFNVPQDLEAHQETFLMLWDGIIKHQSIKQRHINKSHPPALPWRPYNSNYMCFFSAAPKSTRCVSCTCDSFFSKNGSWPKMHPLFKQICAQGAVLHKNSHKAVSSTDFIQELESVVMLQIYLGLRNLNMPKL